MVFAAGWPLSHRLTFQVSFRHCHWCWSLVWLCFMITRQPCGDLEFSPILNWPGMNWTESSVANRPLHFLSWRTIHLNARRHLILCRKLFQIVSAVSYSRLCAASYSRFCAATNATQLPHVSEGWLTVTVLLRFSIVVLLWEFRATPCAESSTMFASMNRDAVLVGSASNKSL